MPNQKSTGFDITSTLVTECALELHRALRKAIDQVIPGVSGARACGRALGLRRHLGWQVYTVAHSGDHATVLRAVPMARGWTLVLKALEKLGCTAAAMQSLKAAIKRLEVQLGTAKADRPALRAAAAGALDTAEQRVHMLRARADATRANEYIHGIKAEAQVSALMIGPADAKGVVDLATVTQLHGLRRSRPGSAWPVYYTLEAYDNQRPKRGVAAGRYGKSGALPLVRQLSSDAAAGALRMRKDGETHMVEFVDTGSGGGGAGGSAAMDLAFIECLRGAGSAKPSDTESRLLFLINTPMDRAVVEVWFHKSVTLRNDPSALLVSSPSLNRRVLAAHGIERLPLEATAVPVDAPKLPRALQRHGAAHAKMLALGAKKLGAPMSEFRGFQLDVKDPPWMSMLVLAFDC
jgi:hypothetical protein